jgi:hypothetical protein
LAVSVTGPPKLQAGLSGTYPVNVSNSGDVSAPVELYVGFNGLQPLDQVTAPSGFDCQVQHFASGGSVHCTTPQLQPKAIANIVVQGRGSAPGQAHLTATISSSDPAAQFVQKSQRLDVSIT